MMKTQLTTRERVTKQIIQLTESHPFWSYLILKMKIEEDTRNELPPHAGAGVDITGRMIYKEEWLGKCTDEEIAFVLAHEVGHLVWGHLLRVGTRNHMVWNIAADAVLNNILRNDGFTPLVSSKSRPDHGCIIPDHYGTLRFQDLEILDVPSMTAEELYARIEHLAKTMDASEVEGRFDQHSEAQGGTDNKGGEISKEDLAGKWKNSLAEAATHAKMKGKLPRGMENLIGNLLDPKMNWKQIIIKYVNNSLPFDSTFSRPNRNFLANGMILPGTIKESIDIVIAVDTSGSVSDDEMISFLSEMKGIARAHRNVNMTIIQGDAQVEEVSNITTRDIRKLASYRRKGYGGTSHIPIFEYIKEKIPKCKLLIAFTDGYSDIDEVSKPNYDVVWAITRSGDTRQIKWGKIVKLK